MISRYAYVNILRAAGEVSVLVMRGRRKGGADLRMMRCDGFVGVMRRVVGMEM